MSFQLSHETIDTIRWNDAGLVAAIVQDAHSKDVLMMAWMNADALQQTILTGETVFWSRSRQEMWHKGATSGNVQHVVDIRIDCDADTLLILVNTAGPACHTNQTTCFFRDLNEFNNNPQLK